MHPCDFVIFINIYIFYLFVLQGQYLNQFGLYGDGIPSYNNQGPAASNRVSWGDFKIHVSDN